MQVERGSSLLEKTLEYQVRKSGSEYQEIYKSNGLPTSESLNFKLKDDKTNLVELRHTPLGDGGAFAILQKNTRQI